MIGEKFNRWTVLEEHSYKCKCLCECGTIKLVNKQNLKRGASKSCGCLKREQTIERSTKHNLRHETKLYGVWASMKQRCYNPRNKKFKRYGSRNIKVCDEWLEFEGFYKWAINNGYEDGLTLDRIDNDKNYYPENCRFTDAKTQANNTSRNVRIEILGINDTLANHERRFGINQETLKYRYSKGLRDYELIKKGRVTIKK